jgi:hypothetical protein
MRWTQVRWIGKPRFNRRRLPLRRHRLRHWHHASEPKLRPARLSPSSQASAFASRRARSRRRLHQHVRKHCLRDLIRAELVVAAKNHFPQCVHFLHTHLRKLRCLRRQRLHLNMSARKLRLIVARTAARRQTTSSTRRTLMTGSAVFGKRLRSLIRIDSHAFFVSSSEFHSHSRYRQAVRNL